MQDCIFCKIVNNELPSNQVYEDDDLLAFEDINPVAPVHILLIPKKHIRSLIDLNEDESNLAAKLLLVASKLGKEYCGNNGFRVVSNIGEDGGQEVKHLHLHIIGGRSMTWPPG
jgi:histidine triad (HIT) family protein